MSRSLLLAALTLALACGGSPDAAESTDTAQTDAPWRQPGDVIDSILPMDEQFRRFRADLPEVTALSGGAPSREALVQALIAAIDARDTVAIDGLTMTRAEFAWLYAPFHQFAEPPYELPPALFWFQIQQPSEKGRVRLLQRLGGQGLRYESHTCDPAVQLALGSGTAHGGCTVVLRIGGAAPDTMALFRGIFERNGVFKFISYANEF
jgi:hypothetical protein